MHVCMVFEMASLVELVPIYACVVTIDITRLDSSIATST